MVSHMYHTFHVKHWVLNACMCKSIGIIIHQAEAKGHNNLISQIKPQQYQYTHPAFYFPLLQCYIKTQFSYLYFLLLSCTQPRQIFAIFFSLYYSSSCVIIHKKIHCPSKTPHILTATCFSFYKQVIFSLHKKIQVMVHNLEIYCQGLGKIHNNA